MYRNISLCVIYWRAARLLLLEYILNYRSVGVLAYVLLSGYTPFGGDTKQETFCNISQCNVTFPDDLFGCISSAAKDFIKTTLVKDPRLVPKLNVHLLTVN